MKNRWIRSLALIGLGMMLVSGLSRAQEPSVTESPAALPPSAAQADAPAPPPVTPPEEELLPVSPGDVSVSGATVTSSTQGNNLISITLDDVPLQDVVRMFTRISGANIIASASNLQGTVSVNIQDVDWKTALESILDMHGLALTEKTPGSRVYSITAKAEGAPEPLISETIKLTYAAVANVLPVVQSLVGANGSVVPFASGNSLVVRTTAAGLAEIKNVISSIDLPRRQVYIEAKFMELSDQAIKDLGINWKSLQGVNITLGQLSRSLESNKTQTRDKRRDSSLSQVNSVSHVDQVNERFDINGQPYEEVTKSYVESPPGSGNYLLQETRTPTRLRDDTIDQSQKATLDILDANSSLKTVTDIRTAVLSMSDFTVMLSALKQINGITIVSNPKIIVANEETATIHIGERQRPFISSVTPGQQGIAPVVTYNPGDAVDFGVKVNVTPTVNTDNNITVKIEPQLTRFVNDAVAPNGQTYPIIATKTIKTVFSLESGKTAAIGGLTETSERDAVSKIPLLGDIPLVGKYLFSHTHKEKTQQETIIFVTVWVSEPEGIGKETGLPEDSDLVHRHMLRQDASRAESRRKIEGMRKAAQDKEAAATP